ADVHVNPGFVRQESFGNLKLGQRPIVVTEPMVSIETFLPVKLSCIRLDLLSFLQGKSGEFPTLIGMIRASPLEVEMSFAHQSVTPQELGVAANGFFQQADALK